MKDCDPKGDEYGSGNELETFTLIHVLISLLGIGSGIIVMYGFLVDQRLDRWTAVFLEP